MIKKSLLVVLLLLLATNLWAVRGPADVSKTRHNFGSTSPQAPDGMPNGNAYTATNEDEVCIFCHTPHGGALNTPLWNRAVPDSAGFTHYSSATLSATVGAQTRLVSDESLLCLSCHDGSIAMSEITNISNRTGAAPDNAGASMAIIEYTIGGRIGDVMDFSLVAPKPAGADHLLVDDHPISFSYSDAYDDTSNLGALHAVADAESAGARFFGATKRVECSSCHDPHVSYYTALGGDAAYNPFLSTPNAGSALCLACHIK